MFCNAEGRQLFTKLPAGRLAPAEFAAQRGADINNAPNEWPDLLIHVRLTLSLTLSPRTFC